jgi:hypothetical protein
MPAHNPEPTGHPWPMSFAVPVVLVGELTNRRIEVSATTHITQDKAVRLKTGRRWAEWFDLLDEWGAASRGRYRPEISERIRQVDR